MEAAVYDLPLASVPTRKPRTPMEVPMPDLDRFNLSGPSLMLLRNRHAIRCQVYRQRRTGGAGRADLWGAIPGAPEAGAIPPANNPRQSRDGPPAAQAPRPGLSPSTSAGGFPLEATGAPWALRESNAEVVEETLWGLWGLLWGVPACGALLPLVGSPPFS
jgi:hypothetical protein